MPRAAPPARRRGIEVSDGDRATPAGEPGREGNATGGSGNAAEHRGVDREGADPAAESGAGYGNHAPDLEEEPADGTKDPR